MTKVNIATRLNNAFTTALRQHLAQDPDVVDTRRYLGSARAAVEAEAAHLLSLLALR
jgi:fructose-bisphosphate aldolase class II